MDVKALTDDQEREVQQLMADCGVDRFTALAALALLPGEILGDGDLYRIRPLTDDERRLLGLDVVPDAVRAEQSTHAIDGHEVGSDPAVKQRTARTGDD